MNRYLYKMERKTADIAFYVIGLIFIGIFTERVLARAWKAAAIIAVIATVFAVLRAVRGPLLGPAILEVTKDELIWRSFFYFPTKIQRNRLESIKAIKIAGPRGDRRFRIELVDNRQQEFRPYYGRLLEPKAVHFLKDSLPSNVVLIEEDPPGVLSQMRGDF